MKNASPGDTVSIQTDSETLEGTLLARSELLDKNILVLKLTTGYNIGISRKKVKKITVLRPAQTALKATPKTKHDPKLPTIAILSTGGTISSKIDYRTGGVSADYTADDFCAMLPELSAIANITTKKVLNIMSEDATSADWFAIAENVIDALQHADGDVITHGTDTMHYTAAALSFLLKDLGKPVIITGAQRSIDRGSSDAFMNLICAVTAASRWNSREVAICMHASMNDDYCHLLRGTKARKMHTSRRDAFRAVNDTPLARVYTDGRIEELSPTAPRQETEPILRPIDKRVSLIYAHPNISSADIENCLKQKTKSILIAATGLGNLPIHTKEKILPALMKAAKKVPIFICAQTPFGRVHPNVYSTMRELSLERGAHYLEDMHAETAFAKLCVAITHKASAKFMRENIAGEYTERSLDDHFL